MSNIITRLDSVKFLLVDDIGYLQLKGMFQYSHEQPSFHDSWTKSFNNDNLSEKEFLYHLLFETELIATIYSLDLNLLEFLQKCQCLNENEISAILIALKIDKL